MAWHLLTNVFFRRKPKHALQTPPKPHSLQWETQRSAQHSVWKNRSSPHRRLSFQLGKNSFHPTEPHTTPDAPTTHRHAEARAKGQAQPRMHARLGPVGTEQGEMEKMGKLGVTEPGRVEREGNGETLCGPNLQISEHTAKLPVFTSSAAHTPLSQTGSPEQTAHGVMMLEKCPLPWELGHASGARASWMDNGVGSGLRV